MPVKRKSVRKPQSGKGFLDALKKVNSFLRENKVISRGADVVGNIAGSLPGSYAQSVVGVSKAVKDSASKYGYGVKRKRIVRRK